MGVYQTIDNRGLSCPQPVVNTKKTLDDAAGSLAAGQSVVSIVDNETALANVQRLVKKAGYQASVEKKKDGIYISIASGEPGEPGQPAQSAEHLEYETLTCDCQIPSGHQPEVVFLVTSNLLGQGHEELGKLLMTSFFNTFLDGEQFPSKILFMNSGVYLTVEGSTVLESLSRMAQNGVEILSCGTCLDYYGLKEQLRVGEVTNMYDTVETLVSPYYRYVTV